MLAGDLRTAAQRVLAELPADWDVSWSGLELDGYLWAEIPEGVGIRRLTFDEEEMRNNIDVFRTSEQPHAPVRLRHCFRHARLHHHPRQALRPCWMLPYR